MWIRFFVATTIASSMLCGALASAQEKQATPKKYAVMPFSIATGIDEKTGKLLDELLLTELSKLSTTEDTFLGSSDIAAVLGLEQQKQMLSCDDETCMAELGNALGVNYLVTPTLGKLGEEFVVNYKVIDPSQVKVVKRDVITVPATEGALRGAIKQLAASILGQSPDSTVAIKPIESQAAEIGQTEQEGIGTLGWVGIGTAALGVALLAGGGIGVGIADSTLGDAGSAGSDKESAQTIYAAGLGGLGVGLVVAGVGAVIAVIGS